jgi:hypothetical protein
MTIRAKVASVLSDSELVFNVGSGRGVHEDDVATVFRQIPISDPDSHEDLGQIRRPVVRCRVTEVQQRMCVGTVLDTVPSAEQAPASGTGYATLFNTLLGTPRTQTKRVTSAAGHADAKTVVVGVGWEAELEPAEGGARAAIVAGGGRAKREAPATQRRKSSRRSTNADSSS